MMVIAETCEELYSRIQLPQAVRMELLRLRDFIYTLYNIFHFCSTIVGHTQLPSDKNIKLHLQHLQPSNTRARIREFCIAYINSIDSRDSRTIHANLLSASMAAVVAASRDGNQRATAPPPKERSFEHMQIGTPPLANTAVLSLNTLGMSNNTSLKFSPTASTSFVRPVPIPVITSTTSANTHSDAAQTAPSFLSRSVEKRKMTPEDMSPVKRTKHDDACKFCTSTLHEINDCPILERTRCKTCNGTGHTAKYCPNKKPTEKKGDY